MWATAERRRLYNKKYYKKWNAKNPEKIIKYRKKYRDRHAEMEKIGNSNYHKAHAKDLCRKHTERRFSNKEKNLRWLCGYLGVKIISCERCEYNESFGSIDSHHLNPNQKNNKNDSLGHWLQRTHKYFTKKVTESKLIYLCKNCHKSLHNKVWKIEELNKEDDHGQPRSTSCIRKCSGYST